MHKLEPKVASHFLEAASHQLQGERGEHTRLHLHLKGERQWLSNQTYFVLAEQNCLLTLRNRDKVNLQSGETV